MKNQFTDYTVDDLQKWTSALVAPIQRQVDALNDNLIGLTAVVDSSTATYSEIVNLINNSRPDWSKDAYTGTTVLPADAGDGNLECYNWYRNRSETLDNDISITAGNPLKAPKTIEPSAHSLWVGNEDGNPDIPRWDKTNGWVSIGGTVEQWDLAIPIPNDLARPGDRLYFQFEAMLATGAAIPSGLQFYACIYDNTAGQRKVIEGGAFTITGSIYGSPGATSVNYKILARTDSGEEALSNTLNFPNAPAVFDQNNHPRINFTGVAGFIEFEIYRQIGSTYVLQYVVRNSIEGTYYDVGNPPVRTVTGFPSVTSLTPKAYAKTLTFSPGTYSAFTFARHDLTIQIPTTYDRGVTGSGQQWLRFGLTGLSAEAGQVLVRKVGLSQGYGLWSQSANDATSAAHSTPSTTPAGSPGGGGGIDPNPGGVGGGGGNCVLMDTLIDCFDDEGIEYRIPLEQLSRSTHIDSASVVCGRCVKVKRAYASRVIRIGTKRGLSLTCTFDHPLITGPTDFNGTAARFILETFKRGGRVHTLTRKPGGEVQVDQIVEMEEMFGDFAIGSPIMEGTHIYIANGFVSHNLKEPTIPE